MSITAKNLSKKYGKKQILTDINLEIHKGEIVAVLGRNGGGKSTLLTLLTGFAKVDSGEVSVAGVVAFVPQDDHLFDDLSVRDNIEFWRKSSKQTQVGTPTYELGVADYLRKKVKSLSGGMRKAVAINCATVVEPDVLVMDEPFAGLDIYYKLALLTLLKDKKSVGKTIVYTSHSLDEIEIADRILLIRAGRLVEIEKTQLDKKTLSRWVGYDG